MITWLFALPVLVAGCVAAGWLLRRNGRLAMRVFLAVDAALLLFALALLVVAVAGAPAQADTVTAAQQAASGGCWARRSRWPARPSARPSRWPTPARRRSPH